MDVNELMGIVHAEGLEAPVLEGNGHLHEDAVVVERDGSTWRVYLVDERTAMIKSTLRAFESESDALEHVLLKLRQVAKARQALAGLSRRKEAASDAAETVT